MPFLVLSKLRFGDILTRYGLLHFLLTTVELSRGLQTRLSECGMQILAPSELLCRNILPFAL